MKTMIMILVSVFACAGLAACGAHGSYTVKLAATNVVGSDAEIKTNYITVSDPPQVGGWTGYEEWVSGALDKTYPDPNIVDRTVDA